MFGYQFDRWHDNFEEIYRVNSYREMQDRDQEYGIVPARIGLEIQQEIPAIEHAARLMRSYSPVRVGIDIFNRQWNGRGFGGDEFIDGHDYLLFNGEIRLGASRTRC